MSEPFLGQIMLFSFAFAPKGWAQCNGQLMPINQNQALFSLLGTTYGGDGRVNFALPDLRGRVPIHRGAGFTQGQRGGSYSHTLTINELPTHMHFVVANAQNATSLDPTGNLLAASSFYGPATNLSALQPASVTSIGGSQPHENSQPYLSLMFCIALQGIFPSQN